MSSGGEFVGVVGAGTMGAGIAQIAALGGYPTAIYELDGKALERGLEQLRGGLRRGAERGRWSEQNAIDALERFETDTIVEVLKDCDLVIEAAPEDLDLKRNLFERLAAACGPDDRSRHQHLLPLRDRDRRGGPRAHADRRHALLQPAGPHAAGGGGRR